MNNWSPRRRVAVLLLALAVSLAHWWLAQLLPDVRIGDGSAERMPKRIEVAYVRELAQAAPPAAAPVVVATPRPARPKKPVPAKPAEAASAPTPEIAPAEEDASRQAQADLPPLPAEPPPR